MEQLRSILKDEDGGPLSSLLLVLEGVLRYQQFLSPFIFISEFAKARMDQELT